MRKKLLLLFVIVIYLLTFSKHKSFYDNRDIFLKDLIRRVYTSRSKINICKELEYKLIRSARNDLLNTSISVMDSSGTTIIDINSNIPRTPASNQKLISTAISLDILGPHHRIKTFLYKSAENTYHLYGNGDPDFSFQNIKQIVKAINKDLAKNLNKKILIYLHEEPSSNWVPQGWSKADKRESYGAPITRLALTSNTDNFAIQFPLSRLKALFRKELLRYGIKASFINSSPYRRLKVLRYKKLFEVSSAPLYSLISLANSESHNFTSEILLRNAFNDWNSESLSKKTIEWLNSNNIITDSFIFGDASGLSNSNKLTTNSIVNLLKLMYSKSNSNYYYSSMSLYGIRGTMSDKNYNSKLYSNFLGKTGSLNNVRAISGIMKGKYGPLFVSIIVNRDSIDDFLIYKYINTIATDKSCN